MARASMLIFRMDSRVQTKSSKICTSSMKCSNKLSKSSKKSQVILEICKRIPAIKSLLKRTKQRRRTSTLTKKTRAHSLIG